MGFSRRQAADYPSLTSIDSFTITGRGLIKYCYIPPEMELKIGDPVIIDGQLYEIRGIEIARVMTYPPITKRTMGLVVRLLSEGRQWGKSPMPTIPRPADSPSRGNDEGVCYVSEFNSHDRASVQQALNVPIRKRTPEETNDHLMGEVAKLMGKLGTAKHFIEEIAQANGPHANQAQALLRELE